MSLLGAMSVNHVLCQQETDGIAAKFNKEGTMNLFIMEMGWGEGILFLDRIALPYLTHLMFVQFIILCDMLF